MPIGGGYGESLARRMGPVDDMDMEPDEDEAGGPPDEDADDAVEASAFDDFAKAAGFKSTPDAYAAFKEAVRACMKR